MLNAFIHRTMPKARHGARWGVAAVCLLAASALLAAPPHRGILVHLQSGDVGAFSARHHVTVTRLNPHRDVYLVQGHGQRSDNELLEEVRTDSQAGRPELNAPIQFDNHSSNLDGQSTGSVLNGQSTGSVLNGQSTGSVLNGQSTGSVLNGKVWYYTSRAPDAYVNQAAVAQTQTGAATHALATGDGVVVGLIDNGVDPSNPVLRRSIDRREGYNFVNNSGNWSAYADVNCQAIASLLDGQSTGSVLNGQSTGSVLNGQSTGSVLNGQSTGSVLNGQSTGSVLNGLGCSVGRLDGQSTGSVLNGQSTGSVLNGQSTGSVLNGQSTGSVLNGQSSFVLDDANTVLILDGQSTGSVLNGQSTGSVLNGQSTGSVLNSVGCPLPASVLDGQSTGSVLNGQSTGSVLNGQSTGSVLNGQSTGSVLNGQSTGSVLNALAQIIACYPEFGHGTSVAGLIHLVAPEAKILPIVAFGPDGSADAATVYEAITYAIDHHVNVLNLSFSATDTTGDVRDAIQEAVNDGIIVAAAAGNGDVSDPVFPASLPGVVGVGAVDGTAANTTFPKADFSNFDPGVGQIVDADVAAPGVKLLTTYPGGGLIWAIATGTSFSTPMVAGEAALLSQMKQAGAASKGDIESSSNPSISGDSSGQLGYGLINALGAVQLAPPAPPEFGHGWKHGDHDGRR